MDRAVLTRLCSDADAALGQGGGTRARGMHTLSKEETGFSSQSIETQFTDIVYWEDGSQCLILRWAAMISRRSSRFALPRPWLPSCRSVSAVYRYFGIKRITTKQRAKSNDNSKYTLLEWNYTEDELMNSLDLRDEATI